MRCARKKKSLRDLRQKVLVEKKNATYARKKLRDFGEKKDRANYARINKAAYALFLPPDGAMLCLCRRNDRVGPWVIIGGGKCHFGSNILCFPKIDWTLPRMIKMVLWSHGQHCWHNCPFTLPKCLEKGCFGIGVGQKCIFESPSRTPRNPKQVFSTHFPYVLTF